MPDSTVRPMSRVLSRAVPQTVSRAGFSIAVSAAAMLMIAGQPMAFAAETQPTEAKADTKNKEMAKKSAVADEMEAPMEFDGAPPPPASMEVQGEISSPRRSPLSRRAAQLTP